jgi:hypothetical protein
MANGLPSRTIQETLVPDFLWKAELLFAVQLFVSFLSQSGVEKEEAL